jgi:hypothetical protein
LQAALIGVATPAVVMNSNDKKSLAISLLTLIISIPALIGA